MKYFLQALIIMYIMKSKKLRVNDNNNNVVGGKSEINWKSLWFLEKKKDWSFDYDNINFKKLNVSRLKMNIKL